MRIGVVSDTHGEAWAIRACLAAAGSVDAWLHLGDYIRDANDFASTGRPVYAVGGNMDSMTAGPRERVVELGGIRIFLCHGHNFGVKSSLLRLTLRAQELACDVALFGHSHMPYLDEGGKLLLMNPGSPSFPRGGSRRSMGLLLIENNVAEGEILPLP